MESRSSKNWWVMKWYAEREEALAWEPPAKPKIKYCCWRVHECPTTQRIHIHILYQFSSVVKYETLVNKDYNNIKWVKPEDLAKKRGYCIDDNHKKTGTPKGVLSAFREIGQWKEPRVTVKKKQNEWYLDAFAATTFEEGVKIIKDNCTRDYAIHGDSIERNLKKSRFETYIPKHQLTEFNIPPIDFEEKAVLVYGETNTGKTQFALANFKNPLLVRHLDELIRFKKENDGIVFDDMSFTNRPPDSIKQLLDWDEATPVHIRYKNATIPAHTKKIFTSNSENPFYEIGILVSDRDAIERRLKRIYVTEKLY